MSKVKFKIGMDNRMRPGQQTRDAILAAMANAATPIPAVEANPVEDPITGQLIETSILVPPALADAAKNLIEADSAVASCSPAIPNGLSIYALNAAGGMAKAFNFTEKDLTETPPIYDGRMDALAADEGSFGDIGVLLGRIIDVAGTDTYAKQKSSKKGCPTSLVILWGDPSTPLVIASGSMSLKLLDDTVINLTHDASITLEAYDDGVNFIDHALLVAWIDENGKLYESKKFSKVGSAGVWSSRGRTYEESINFPL